MNGTPFHILLVEDNPADVRLIEESLKENKLLVRLSTVGDGETAIDFLGRQGKHANAVRPDLILLDLNLPRKDGRAVLAEIKADDRFKAIPVVVLTSSSHEEDVAISYGLHANCYVRKPIDINEFIKIVQHIDAFWFSVVKLPPKNGQ